MGFHILCIVREVLDTRDLFIDPIDSLGNLKMESLDTRFDPEDLNALEMALRIKDQTGAMVQCITIGKERKVDVLRECLYRGVDKVTRLDDPMFNDLDALSQAIIYGRAIQKLGKFDLILTGMQIPEGENSSIGEYIAKYLSINSISYVEEIDKMVEGKIRVKRCIEGGFEIIESPLPVLITVGVALLKEDPRSPRSPKATLKLKHKKTPIPTLGIMDLMLRREEIQPVVLKGDYKKVQKRQIERKEIRGDDLGSIREMLMELRESGCLR
jgi:electron transfer flavoprotein beta subunit